MSKYPDYQEITRDNFEAITKDMHRLVMSWLHRSRSPKRHWQTMTLHFWGQVWVDRGRFDRSKGALTTWLGWQWRDFATRAARRSAAGQEDPPLYLRDGYQHPRQVITTNWGLDPEQAQVEDYGGRGEERSHKESPLLRDYKIQEARLETERQIAILHEAINKLPPKERRLVRRRLSGVSLREAGEGFVSRQRVHQKMTDIVILLRKIISETRPDLSSRNDTYWQEYRSTTLKSTPHWGNDWSHAAETRLRNRLIK
jgi:RNA polymerase sigma factor (sigma-70 family)